MYDVHLSQIDGVLDVGTDLRDHCWKRKRKEVSRKCARIVRRNQKQNRILMRYWVREGAVVHHGLWLRQAGRNWTFEYCLCSVVASFVVRSDPPSYLPRSYVDNHGRSIYDSCQIQQTRMDCGTRQWLGEDASHSEQLGLKQNLQVQIPERLRGICRRQDSGWNRGMRLTI